MKKRTVSPIVSKYMSELGKKGGSKGGKTAAKNLTPEQRKARAIHASKAAVKSRKAKSVSARERGGRK